MAKSTEPQLSSAELAALDFLIAEVQESGNLGILNPVGTTVAATALTRIAAQVAVRAAARTAAQVAAAKVAQVATVEIIAATAVFGVSPKSKMSATDLKRAHEALDEVMADRPTLDDLLEVRKRLK